VLGYVRLVRAIRRSGSRRGVTTSQVAGSRSDGTLAVALVCVIAAALLYVIFGLFYGSPTFVE
jgi:hypothetical protein